MTYLMVFVVITIWAYVFYNLFGNKDKPDSDSLHSANTPRLNNSTQNLVINIFFNNTISKNQNITIFAQLNQTKLSPWVCEIVTQNFR